MRPGLRASVAAAMAAAALAGAAPASASTPWWHLDSGSRPSSIPTGGSGELVVTAENVGEAQTSTEPVTVSDVLPAGLRATGIAGTAPKDGVGSSLGETVALTCSLEHLSCESSGHIAPYDTIEMRIAVQDVGAQSGEANAVTVIGGGAPDAHISRPVLVGQPAGFGVEGYELAAEAEGGGAVTQAGAHTFQVTGSILLDQGSDAAPLTSAPDAGPAVPARDVVAKLPPGLVANPSAVARCLSWQFAQARPGDEQDQCPYRTAVGVASVIFDQGGLTRTVATPIFNIEPEPGEPAQFGFFVPIEDVPIVLRTSVRSTEDWGVDLSSSEIPQDAGISSVRVTFWGVVGSWLHNQSRGWGCLAEARGRTDHYEGCTPVEESEPPAFVTLPTSCTSSLASSLEADSWTAPGAFASFPASEPLAALTGCQNVPFSPAISTATSTGSASSPSGFSFDLTYSREGLTSSTSIAQSNLLDTVVSLPEGLTIDPSAGVGLGACTPTQYAEATLSSPQGAGCPEDSKLGTVEVETPLLFTTIYGSLYLATPYENPFPEPGHPGGSMIALYVIARSRAERGIIVKLAGRVHADPNTGRLTVFFENDPPLQFDRFNFHFREGAQAPLISPSTCGTYTTTAQLTPYSTPENPLMDTASFQVSSGSEGSACPGSVPPFEPNIQANTLISHAGSFSPLYVTLARTDAMQEIGSYSTVLPVGLTADLTGVAKCPVADIEAARRNTGVQEEQQPSCPQASLIGHSLVGTGVGAILDYVPGALYLSGPFHGDPLSVVSITSAVVGPFDLGTVVIRFGLRIDPYTAQVSIDPTGSEPIPRLIDGIVVHVRDIKVSIDRPNFTINPTSCNARPISSTLTSISGQKADTSTLLHAERCDELKFKPHFSASTSGKTSRRRGASLSVKLSMPLKLGSESNIKLVKVELPRQLPAELPTLQQACTAAQFNANPAGCPPGSIVGHARATTPILPEPLSGPAIFVSHGGVEFPSLVLVLQGYGFTIDLVGATYVSHEGILSSTFHTIPDEPVGSFSLTLPEGRHPALAADTDLCRLTAGMIAKDLGSGKRRHKRKRHKGHAHKANAARASRRHKPHKKAKGAHVDWLPMPTTFIAQNGIRIRQVTHIRVVGCGGHRGHGRHHAGKRTGRRHS